MKNRFWKKFASVMMTAGLILLLNLVFSKEVQAVNPWHEVYLTPGQAYDVSAAKSNTTVYINRAGDYTLYGQSSKVRIIISSGDVNVYLANGLSITPEFFLMWGPERLRSRSTIKAVR